MRPSRFLLSVLIIPLAIVAPVGQQSPSEPQEQSAPPNGDATLQQPHNFNLTPADKTRKNPIRFTDISVARGKDLFKTQCAMCHREKGDGKGDLADAMKVTIPDFTKPDVLSKWTDGELFALIGQGCAPMPGQKERLTADHVWDLVNFLRDVEGLKPALATAEEREKARQANTVIVPAN